MKPSELATALRRMLPTKRPVMIWGSPGIGKSDTVRQVAIAENRQLIDLRVVLLDPVDLRGIPRVNGGNTTHWCPPSFLPTSGDGILFLDEIPQAPPMVQAACLQLTLDRRLGEYMLPDGWIVWMAGNRQTDRAGSQRLISPLLNRLIHFTMETEVEDWLTWALNNGIHHVIRSFVRFRPGLLNNFQPNSTDNAFPTPRTWQFASEVLNAFPHTDGSLLEVFGGVVGPGAAAELVAYIRIASSLPDVDKMLADPGKAKMPTEPDVCYALVGAVIAKAQSDKTLSAKAAELLVRLSPEFATFGLRDLVRVDSTTIVHPAVKKFTTDNRDLFVG